MSKELNELQGKYLNEIIPNTIWEYKGIKIKYVNNKYTFDIKNISMALSSLDSAVLFINHIIKSY